MRLLSISLLSALFATVVFAEGPEQPLAAAAAPNEVAEDADTPDPTIFNGIEVPPLLDINGEQFSTITKDGYWFVKHHS